MDYSLGTVTRYRRFLLATTAVALLAGCGGKQAAEPAPLPDLTSPVVSPDTASTEAESEADEEGAPLPDMPAEHVFQADTLPPSLVHRQFDLYVPGQDLKPVLRLLSRRSGINFIIDPNVQGQVSVDLTDVSTVEALDYLLTPLGYAYEYKRGAVWIERTNFETRVFSLNYAITGRRGSKTLNVGAGNFAGGGALGRGGGLFGRGAQGQAQGGGQATGGQQLGGFAGGGRGAGVGGGQFGTGQSTVTSGSTAEVFRDLQEGLEALVFGSNGGEQAAEGAGARTRGQAAPAEDSRAFSRTDTAGRRLIINPMAGLVQIRAEPEAIDQAARFIEAIQGSVERQVLIEAQIVEVGLGEQSKFGIDWSAVLDGLEASQAVLGPRQNGDFEVTVTEEDVEAVLQALARRNEVRTLSSPRVSTLNNQKTVLQATTQEVFFSSVVSRPVVADGTVIPGERQFIPRVVPVGVVVDVTPQISADGEIIMDIRPSVSEIRGTARSPEGDTQPILDVRTIDTMARVTSGQTIVIGGLIQEREKVQESRVPVMGEIPVVGNLFRSRDAEKQRSQLVIFLTPYVQAGRRVDELTEAERMRLRELMRSRQQ